VGGTTAEEREKKRIPSHQRLNRKLRKGRKKGEIKEKRGESLKAAMIYTYLHKLFDGKLP